MIAQRTKDALQAAKARGVVLGNPELNAVRDRAVASVKADADRFANNVAPIIREIQSSGVTSNRGIALALRRLILRCYKGWKTRPFIPRGRTLRYFASSRCRSYIWLGLDLAGSFPEETSSVLENGRIAFCHIDVDAYQSGVDIIE